MLELGLEVRLGLVLKVLKFYMCLFFLFAGVPILSILLFDSCYCMFLFVGFPSCVLNYMVIRVELILTPRYVLTGSGTHHFHGLIQS
jgi:hypothetical protein